MLTAQDRKDIMLKDNRNLTTELVIRTLRYRYTAEPVPPCRVCGEDLTVQACGGGEPTVWACTANGIGDHYDRSMFVQRKTGDSLVLELLSRIEVERQEIDVLKEECELLRRDRVILADAIHVARGALLGIGTDYAKGVADALAGALDRAGVNVSNL